MRDRWEVLDVGVESLEKGDWLDGMVRLVDWLTSPVERTRLFPVLRGDWLGHALHPLLTDLQLASWASATLLDVTSGAETRGARRRLVGVGLAVAPLTMAAGAAEWRLLRRASMRRVAAVHAVGNLVATLAYLRSWRSRRDERHPAGILWGLVGGLVAVAAGYLGGHLSFGRGVGRGRRGRPSVEATLDARRFRVVQGP